MSQTFINDEIMSHFNFNTEEIILFIGYALLFICIFPNFSLPPTHSLDLRYSL